jgi:hypothetical protein
LTDAVVPPGPVTVTVSTPEPLACVVSVNGVPEVGVVVESVPPVLVADRLPVPPVSVAVIATAVFTATSLIGGCMANA